MGSAIDLAQRLPEPETLRLWLRSLATLDTVLSPEWEYRYFSYDPVWSETEHMASIRNGSGDEANVVFGPSGTYIRMFDHESALSPWRLGGVAPGVVAAVPSVVAEYVTEPSFGEPDGGPAITACVWRLRDDERWSAGVPSDPLLATAEDGAWLLDVVDGEAASYRRFAEDYYEVPVDAAVVAAVLASAPLSREMVTLLNPEAEVDEVLAEVATMGYPVAEPVRTRVHHRRR